MKSSFTLSRLLPLFILLLILPGCKLGGGGGGGGSGAGSPGAGIISDMQMVSTQELTTQDDNLTLTENFTNQSAPVNTAVIPEPATFSLLLGGAALFFLKNKQPKEN
jgi:hypothetical protein